MANVQISTLGSQIKSAYESQPNTNAFTTAEKTKLAGLTTSYVIGLRSSPVTGATVTVPSTVYDIYNLILTPAGTLATLTITFPTTNLRDWQTIKINSTQAVTALTMNGGTINAAATSLTANSPLAWTYNPENTTWYRTT